MYKRFIKWFIIFSIVITTIVCTLIYFLDPLYLYHKLNDDNYYGATERYQMPGLVKNLDYETLLVGTSMGRNFVEAEVDKWFDTKSFNGSLPASTAREQRMVADLSIANHDLKNIIWEINYYSFSNQPDWVEEGASPFPIYMYDQNYLNDLKYLLNPYSRKMAVVNWTANINNKQYHRDPYMLYKFGDEIEKFSIEKSAELLKNTTSRPINENETAQVMIKSFDNNVISFVEAHPEIQFSFFYAPYSIVIPVQFNKIDPEFTEERIEFKRNVYEQLQRFDNVKLFDFQDNEKIVYNTANYMTDAIHYYRYVNDWIIEELASGKPVTSIQEYDKRLEEYKKMIEGFNILQLQFEEDKTP